MGASVTQHFGAWAILINEGETLLYNDSNGLQRHRYYTTHDIYRTEDPSEYGLKLQREGTFAAKYELGIYIAYEQLSKRSGSCWRNCGDVGPVGAGEHRLPRRRRRRDRRGGDARRGWRAGLLG